MTCLTVITVNFNSGDNLFKTINSVNSYKKRIYLKHIIIDGGSTDISNQAVLDLLGDKDVYISERDAGIYDAMNKAFKYINEDSYLTWINSGDILINANLTFKNLESTHPDCLICTTIELCHVSNEQTIRHPNEIVTFNNKNFLDFKIHHQGFIIKKSCIKSFYDISIGSMSDKLFMIQNLNNTTSVDYSSIPHCAYLTGGVSDKPNISRILSHYFVARKLNLNICKIIFYSPAKAIRFFLRNIIPYFLFIKIRKYVS